MNFLFLFLFQFWLLWNFMEKSCETFYTWYAATVWIGCFNVTRRCEQNFPLEIESFTELFFYWVSRLISFQSSWRLAHLSVDPWGIQSHYQWLFNLMDLGTTLVELFLNQRMIWEYINWNVQWLPWAQLLSWSSHHQHINQLLRTYLW